MASISPVKRCQLPEEYEYKLIEFEEKAGNNYCTISFRIKNIKTEEDVEKWLKDYEEKSKLTWRKSRVVKASGKINIFRRDLRCQHNTDVRKRAKGIRVTKNTNCPATMKIVIKRFIDEPKLKKIDDEVKLFPCVVNLHNWHNHMLNSASVLRFRDISTGTKEKLLKYFQTGHTASSERNALQTELMLQSSDDFSVLEADSSILPSLSTIQHLYNKSFKNTYGSKKELKTFEKAQNLINLTSENDDDKEELKKQIRNWTEELCRGIDEDPEIFIPAIKKMMMNHKKFCTTQTGLISALHNFGKIQGPRALSVNGKRKGVQISVQPTAIAGKIAAGLPFS